MAKGPKAKAEDQTAELKRYKAPKHAGDVHLPSGVKKIRGGIVSLPVDAIAEHELLIRAGFKHIADDADAADLQQLEDEHPEGEPAGDAPSDLPPTE